MLKEILEMLAILLGVTGIIIAFTWRASIYDANLTEGEEDS